MEFGSVAEDGLAVKGLSGDLKSAILSVTDTLTGDEKKWGGAGTVVKEDVPCLPDTNLATTCARVV